MIVAANCGPCKLVMALFGVPEDDAYELAAEARDEGVCVECGRGGLDVQLLGEDDDL